MSAGEAFVGPALGNSTFCAATNDSWTIVVMKVNPTTWEHLLEWETGDIDCQPLHRLIAAITRSPFADGLYPTTSMLTLIIANTKPIDIEQEVLRVDFDTKSRRFKFEYVEHTYISQRWRKECSEEEGFSSFVHFLVLKQWFPEQATDIGRTAWSIDEAE